MSKYTPGPWYYRRPLHPASLFKFEVNARNNGIFKPYVCDVRSLDADGQDNSEANARLIAATPDLLAALREFIADIDAVGLEATEDAWPDLSPTYKLALKAIAKAGV